MDLQKARGPVLLRESGYHWALGHQELRAFSTEAILGGSKGTYEEQEGERMPGVGARLSEKVFQ